MLPRLLSLSATASVASPAAGYLGPFGLAGELPGGAWGEAARIPTAWRCPRWVSALALRIAGALAVCLLAGLLAATLVRTAPGFGMDERLLDSRLADGSREAIERQGAESANVAAYYWNYLRRLTQGDLGTSVSLGRPVKELLAERLAVSVLSGLAGLALAWLLALTVAVALGLRRRRGAEAAASAVTGALLCAPSALVALVCVYIGAGPAVAIACIVFPRIFRYLRDLAREAGSAPHILAAHAMGVSPLRVIARHLVAPVLPELLALAGVSISMAVGATIPVEALCDSPGVGQLIWQAAQARDLPVLVNVTLLIAAITVIANLIADTARAAREAQV